MALEMSQLDTELSEALERRRAQGVVDIKTTHDTGGHSTLEDFKRTMLNVLRQDEAGLIPHIPLREITSFDHFYEKFFS